MFRFSFKTEIKKPIDEVYELFRNRNKMQQWQPGLSSVDKLEEKNGMKRYKLTFRIGNRNMIMTETILKDALPHFNVSYTLKGIENIVENTFISQSQHSTLWISDAVFKFSGIKKLISVFMKGGFEKQTQIIMNNFKSFAEHQ
ncbi:MAG TPA: SRPBCC family protein [Saprospiraceae bacterium]|nr:SRPBCC family protein [Saprospiraceae bacterium]